MILYTRMRTKEVLCGSGRKHEISNTPSFENNLSGSLLFQRQYFFEGDWDHLLEILETVGVVQVTQSACAI